MSFAILTFSDDEDGYSLRDELLPLGFDDDEEEEEENDEPLFSEDEEDDNQITTPGEVFLAARVIAATRYILGTPEDDVMLEFTDPEHPGLVVQVHIAARYGEPVSEESATPEESK